MRIKTIIFIVVLAGFAACVEKFNLPENESDFVLVVDGWLTNLKGPYTVKLSSTSGLDKTFVKPVSGAKVTIRQKDGPFEILVEKEAGVYLTGVDGIRGIVGKSYRLEIQVNGKKYETDYTLLKEPTGIQSVESRFEYQSTFESPDEVPGIQFFVNTELSPYESDYYLWQLEGTYKYHANLLIYYVYSNKKLKEFNNHDSLYTCYRTYDISNIYTASTSNLTQQKIVLKPLLFLPANDIKLTIRYSLLTTQYSINKNAYNYWHAVDQQSSKNGSLYTTQPYQIKGNVRNLNNPDDIVLGYFTVAGVTENRIFRNTPIEVNIEMAPCIPDPEALRVVFDSEPEEWPIYLPGGNVGIGWVNKDCLDCQELGGKLNIPDFWID